MSRVISFTEKYLRDQKKKEEEEAYKDFYKNCIAVSSNLKCVETEDGEIFYLVKKESFENFVKSLNAKIKRKLKKDEDENDFTGGPDIA